MRKVAVWCFVVTAMSFATSCATAVPTPTERAHAIESQVWSPYCPGRLLIDCTTSQARDLRIDIQRRVDRGDEANEILTWVRREFGPEAIARPDGSAKGLTIWLVPLALFVAGGALVFGVVRRWTRRDVSPATAPQAPPRSESTADDTAQRLRDEVRRTL